MSLFLDETDCGLRKLKIKLKEKKFDKKNK